MTKLLIDTNIFIYDLDNKSIYHDKAKDILNSDFQLYTTSKNISEFVSVASKFSIEYKIISEYLKDILRNLIILFPTHSSLNIFQNLIKKYNPIGNRVYDIEVASIMIDNQIEQIATFNIKDFKNIDKITIHGQKQE